MGIHQNVAFSGRCRVEMEQECFTYYHLRFPCRASVAKTRELISLLEAENTRKISYSYRDKQAPE